MTQCINAETELKNINEVFQLGKRWDKPMYKDTTALLRLISRYDLLYLTPLHSLQVTFTVIAQSSGWT